MAKRITKNINAGFMPSYVGGYPVYTYGGRMKYGFGSWLGENAGMIGTVAGGAIGTALAPGIGTSLGASIGGSIGGSVQQGAEGNQQNELLAQQQREALKRQTISNLPAQHNYQPTFAMGGKIKYPYGGGLKSAPHGKATAEDIKLYEERYPKEMAMGVQVEYEHTKNKDLAKRIAADHIKDFEKMHGGPGYYQGLKQFGLTDELAKGGLMNSYTNGGKVIPKTFLKNYISSPKYKERLESSKYENIEDEISKRFNNVNNTQVKYQNSSESFYDAPNNSVIVNKNQADELGTTVDEIETHEFGHAELRPKQYTDRYQNIGMRDTRLNMFDNLNLKHKMKPNPSRNQHDSFPDENKADINTLRFLLKQQGIYDAGYEDFNREHLDKIDSYTKDRLLNNYTEEDLIWLMNNIAKNNKVTDKVTAAKGGLINSYAGGGKLSNKISKLVDEGYPQDQAVAIAHSMQDRNKLAEGGYHAVKASETSGDDPKYPINSADDVKDAWKLRNHAKGLDISKETLKDRIKRKANEYDVDLPTKAFGGNLDNTTNFETGGSHQTNPMGGIPLGNNALVEQGEVKFKDYIFSDKIPYKKK